MKVIQQVDFRPINITLETSKEANTFWAMLSIVEGHGDGEEKRMAITLSDLFTEKIVL